MQPWDQKVSKGPKETFSTLRINIRVVYGTWRKLQISQIIVHFGIFSISLCEDNPIFGPPGKAFSKLVEDKSKYFFVFLEARYLSNSQNYVFIKFTALG